MKKVILLALCGLSLVSCKQDKMERENLTWNRKFGKVKQIVSRDSMNMYSFYRTEVGKREMESMVIRLKDSLRLARRIEEENRIEEKRVAGLRKIMSKYDCTEEEAELFLKRRIWIGMPIKMVVSYRGLPNYKNTSNYGDGNRYQYCWEDYDPSCFYCGSDGIVTSYN